MSDNGQNGKTVKQVRGLTRASSHSREPFVVIFLLWVLGRSCLEP